MPTAEKAQVIEQTREWYSKSSGVVFTDYRGLKVKDLQALRASLREKGAELHIVKNTLFRQAAGEAGQNLPFEYDNGTTAYAFVFENEPEVAKLLLDYARTSKKLVVKGGLFAGRAYTSEEVVGISELPSKEVLISQVIGAIAAPLTNLVGVIEALYADPIRTIYAVADKVNEGVETPATTSEETPAEAPAAEAVAEPEATEAPAETPATPEAEGN